MDVAAKRLCGYSWTHKLGLRPSHPQIPHPSQMLWIANHRIYLYHHRQHLPNEHYLTQIKTKQGSNPSAVGWGARGRHGWTEPEMQFSFSWVKATFMKMQPANFRNKLYHETERSRFDGGPAQSPQLSISAGDQAVNICKMLRYFALDKLAFPDRLLHLKVTTREASENKHTTESLKPSAPLPPWLSSSISQRCF